MNDLKPIIDRLKQLTRLKSEGQIAALLGMKPWQFTGRKKRQTLLPALVEWALKENISLDWLVHGYGLPSIHFRQSVADHPEALKDPDLPVRSDIPPCIQQLIAIQPTDTPLRPQDLLDGFKNLPIAQEIVHNMLELEAINPSTLFKADIYIRGLLDGANFTSEKES